MSSTAEYDVDYFTTVFSTIPEEQWCEENYHDVSGARCAYGHLGADWGKHSRRADALEDLFMQHFSITASHVNDGGDRRFNQPTPKQRILAALQQIKEQQDG